MTNPYRPPSMQSEPANGDRTKWISLFVGCYLLLVAVLFAAVAMTETIASGQLRDLGGGSTGLLVALASYGIFKRVEKARQIVFKLSLFVSVAMALVGLMACVSKSPVIIPFFPSKTYSIGQMVALTAATAFTSAFPGLLLMTPDAKREFADRQRAA